MSDLSQSLRASDQEPRTGFRPGALLLAWLWPGLGHFAIGERSRAWRIMAGILLLLLCGVFIGGVDSVDHREDRLWFYAQAGAGPIVFGVTAVNTAMLKTGRVGRLLPAPNLGGGAGLRVVSDRRGLAHSNEFGTLFIALAGLMNIAVMLDAGFRRTEYAP